MVATRAARDTHTLADAFPVLNLVYVPGLRGRSSYIASLAPATRGPRKADGRGRREPPRGRGKTGTGSVVTAMQPRGAVERGS